MSYLCKEDQFFVNGLIIGFFGGIGVGLLLVALTNTMWKQKSIENGVGEFNNVTGDFQFKKFPKILKETNEDSTL